MEERGEVDVKDMRELEDIVSGDSQRGKLFEETFLKVKQYADFRGKLAESPDSLYQCLKSDDEMSRKIELLYVRIRTRLGQDMAQQGYQDMFAGVRSLSYEASKYSSFIAPEILSIPEEALDDFMKADNGISHFRHTLETIFDKRRHTLFGEMEELLVQSYSAIQGTSQVFIMSNNADVGFPVITGEDGEGVQITHGNYISLMENKDRRIGEDAFERLHSVYAQYSNILVAAFSSSVKRAVLYARAKKYESSR